MKQKGRITLTNLPLMGIASLCLFAPLAVADNVLSPTTTPGKEETTTPAEPDQNSMLRGYTWESSFDKAGDATKDAAKALNQKTSYDCTTLTGDQKVKCDQANLRIAKEAKAAAEEAAGIRDMQYIFADASRVSDIAAVGAIGATGYAQLIKRNASQSESLRGAANIQETAGYVSYASGAADISMGAYAYAMQKRQLENIKEKLSGKGSGLNMSDPALMSKISKAEEETKKAAYSHMMYGAGKVAIGYASMHLAKQNRKQAASLESLVDVSIPTANPYQSGVAAPAYKPSAAGGVPYYQNNNPQFILPTDSGNSTSTGTTKPVVTGNTGGSSVMPSPELRGLASLGNKNSGFSGSSGGGGGAAPSAPEAGKTPEEEAAEAAAAAKAKEATSGFELNLGGGNGSRYGGGSGGGDKAEDGGVAGLLSGMMGGASTAPTSNATGLNPNSLYRDATEGLSGEEQGSMAGVSGKDESLFKVVKTKYNKMMEVGRLAGPGTVEVRN